MSATMSDLPARAPPDVASVRRALPPADEAQLVARAMTGDSAAADQLIRTHQQRINRLVHRLLGWPSDVEDVVQDVFVDALRCLFRFDGRSALSTWLVRIAVNRCRTHQRRRWLKLGMLRRLRGEPVRSAPAASERVDLQETIRNVHAAIRKLSPRDREIIVLRYLEELPAEEIAHLLGASRATIDTRLSRARRRLETILKPLME